VEDADDLNPGARRAAGLGPAAGRGGGRDERRAIQDRSLLGRPDRAPLGCFDAASQGTVEAFMASTVHWPTKDPALPWFSTVPFGMNPEGMLAWFYQSDGLKLWEETYAAYNLVPRPGPGAARQMAGWFRKKITTTADFKGSSSASRASAARWSPRPAARWYSFIPGGEIYAALERGVIDPSEFIGPHDDMKLGLHNTAHHYY